MKTAEQIVADATSHGVVLYLKDGQLAYVAEAGRFPEDLKAEIRANRDAVVALLSARAAEELAQARPVIRRMDAVPRLEHMPASYAQHQVWLADQMDPGGARFNMSMVLRLQGALRHDALHFALDELVRRHEILRTVYVRVGDAPVQCIQPARSVPVTYIDLTSLREPERTQEVARHQREEGGSGFDLATDLMLRVRLVATAPQETFALFTMHHIASDGWSMGLLIREFVEYYTACVEDRPARCEPLAVQYVDYASWQRANLEGELRSEQLGYWKEQLSGVRKGPALSTDKPRPTRTSLRAGINASYLGARLSTDLQAFAAARGITAFIVLQTAFALLIGRWSGHADVVIGTPVAGRTDKAVEPLIGLFVNLLALRTRFVDSDTFTTLLARNREMILDAYAHQDLPFELVVEEVLAERDLRVFPLFQTVFNLQNVGQDRLLLPGLEVTSQNAETVAKFDLEVTVEEGADGLWVQWKYAADLFDPSTAEELAACYLKVLEGIVADPGRRVSSLAEEAGIAVLAAASRIAPAVSTEAAAAEMSLAEPETATERLMATLWQQILGHERIGTESNFFDLGGNSLKAMRLATLVAETFHVPASVRALFENPTIAALGRHVDAHALQGSTRIPVAPDDKPVPLSFAQQRLWFIDQLNDGSPHYNMPVVLRVHGELNLVALHSSLNAIMARHATLRTVFAQTSDGPVQVVQPWSPVPLPIVDLQGQDAPAQAQSVSLAVRTEAAAVFDLARDAMLRARLLSLSAREHVLVLVVHHIASDGWSMDILQREFVALYQAYLEGREADLPVLDIQYADYACWQQETYTLETLEGQRNYWEALLRGAPAMHSLPLDRPRPPRQDFAGALCRRTVGKALLDDLETLGKRHDATLFMVLQAAFVLLLSRWSQQEDIVIASPTAGRASSQVEGLIGFFVNTLAFRHALPPEKRFDELLVECRQQMLEAFARQDFPFEMLVEQLQLERSLSHNPLTQVLFTLQAEDQAELASLDLRIEAAGGADPVTKFDIELMAVVKDGSVQLEWCYARSLFDASTIMRMADSFEVLLRAIVEAPDQRLCALPVLGAQEREHALFAFNDTARDFPDQMLIHELFESVAVAYATSTAVVFEGQCLDYAELNARSNQVAHALLAQGVKPDNRVAICAERSLDLVIGLLGILKSGAAYVPLDPSYPAERLAYMLHDCAPVALVAQARVLSLLPAPDMPVLRLDDAGDLALLARQPRHNPDPCTLGLGSRNLAYVIYTSGSTGLPKGAMNEHRAVVNRLLWAKEAYALGADDRVLQKTPFGFDVSVWEFFLPLLSGARLVIARPGGHQEPDYLVDLIDSAGITTLHFVPSMLPAFLEHARADACQTVRRVLCSGEALPFPMQQQVMRHLPHVELHNLYGPTEAAIDVTSWRCEPGKYDGFVPIGRPIANIRIYILDAQREPVPVGAPGELYIAGVGVARGYLNRNELTRERFVDDRFGAEPGATMYKTGDLARWLPDGNIEYLGRNDFQVKIRGFRVELGEIEARLGACAGVREAVVLAREDAPGNPQLVAYLVLDAGRALVTGELRAQLARNLPEFMLPTAFVAMECLPLTANGKLDRNALPAPEASGEPEHVHGVPATATEYALCDIWQSLLKRPRVGVHDNFFEIGGHSLLAARAAHLIAERCGRKVPIRTLFERPTVAELAPYIDGQAEAALAPIPPAPDDQRIPLSFAQQRLWFFDTLDKGSPQYNMPAALRLHGQLDREALRRSLETVIERHAVLRTVYLSDAEGPVQVVQPMTRLELPVVDLTGLEPKAQADAIDRELRAELTTPFDLSCDRMLRVRLLALAEQQHVLLATMHHIASDGWSIGVLTREFALVYTACCEGRQADLPVLEIQYADYAHWQRANLTEEKLQAQWSYWEQALRDAPVAHNLPLDRPRPPQQRFEGAIIQQRLDVDVLRGLKQLAARSGTTLFVVLQSALAVLLSRWSNESDIVIGSPVATRTHHQVAPLIGFFVSMLAFRHRLSRDLSFEEVLANARRQALDAFANQDIPFEVLVNRLQAGGGLPHSPIFQVAFNLHNNEPLELSLPGLEASLLPDAGNMVRFDIEVSATEAEEGLWLNWNFAVSLFEASSIRRMADGLALLLEGVLADPGVRVADLPILSATDRSLLASWEKNDATYPADLCIQTIFENRVERAPEATAVILGGDHLTYGELNERANRVAHALLARGVKPDQLVGISVERSFDMIVAALAVLKAGAAYVPFDASYPDDRLRDMLEDSGVGVVLTHGRMLERGLVDAGCCIALDDDALFVSCPVTNPVVSGLTPDHLAYVVYTSGSTGRPKGVAVVHRGVTRLIDNPEYVPLGPGTRMGQISAFAFDSSVLEIFGALLNGGALILYSGRELDVGGLPSWLHEHEVNTLFLTSALFEAWAELVQAREDVFVKHVMMGGDVVSARSVAKVYALDPEVTIIHAYGPTENTVYTTCHVVSRDDAKKATLPIGRPIKQTSLHVLDIEGRPVPIGVGGELHVGGAGLAREYWRRPELTQERFVRLGADGERVYKTGDRVKFLADGNLQFLGRMDSQVKIRGFRVEPGEIEYQLRRNARIADALVLVDGSGVEKRLVAYVVARQPIEEELADLVDSFREELKQTLAEYLVPNAFIVLDAFPVTPNGKVDRAALPKADFQSYIESRFVAPATETEMMLTRIWQDVLGLDKVGTTVDFFQVGGNSLNMTRLQNEIRRVYGVTVPLKALFLRTTILEQAPLVVGLAASAGSGDLADGEIIEEVF
jgi:amino acid adenylation domain-containing protein